MGRLLGVGALALGLLVATGPATRPLGLAGPDRQAKEMIGIIVEPGGTTLTRLGEGLDPFGPRLRVGYADAWTIAPEGRIAAFSTHPTETSTTQDSMRFVALGSLRLVRRPIALHGYGLTLFWPTTHRILALVHNCCAATDDTSIAVIDPGARRIVSRISLGGDAAAWARAGDRLVVLVTPTNAIGPARVAVVDAVGRVRTTKLARIDAGRSLPEDHSSIGTQRIPALAADAATGRAYVVEPEGLAAEVSLDSLAVSYHELAAESLAARLSAWLQPSAEAKGMNGTSWHGVALGNGFVAVTGTVEHTVMNGNAEEMSSSPGGLAIVDIRNWTIRAIDRGADDVAVTDGLLLATGRSWSSSQQRTTGMGLVAYGSDTKLRFHVFQGDSAWVQQTWNGRAYVLIDGRTNVVDLATGRIVEQRAGTTPWLLLP